MQTVLNANKVKNLSTRRRRDLIPKWIKFFVFLFLLLGFLGVCMIFIRTLMGSQIGESTIYGLESTVFFSPLGILIHAILIFKVVVSYGLWTEKDWAVKCGIIDAIFGLIVCITVMVILPFVASKGGKNELNLRFEILLLIPYLYQLLKIRREWEIWSDIVPVNSTVHGNIENKIVIEKINQDEKEIEIENHVEETIDKEDPSRFMPK
ncbi:hypothetical protein [Flavobacterium pectinovorum]|uniref:Uncharacterized protein n=1 Tax=Flavobacterium pectinovorum TaxID=29533 RepID=A0A502F5Y7_9FLAO|nr:hypothetical protein [Flavobacterium pectinovorum]TPG44056.1 hypothetical protein EAH81_05755 [Flavobacterium pectinovorum]